MENHVLALALQNLNLEESRVAESAPALLFRRVAKCMLERPSPRAGPGLEERVRKEEAGVVENAVVDVAVETLLLVVLVVAHAEQQCGIRSNSSRSGTWGCS